jgi:hypothetical protein
LALLPLAGTALVSRVFSTNSNEDSSSVSGGDGGAPAATFRLSSSAAPTIKLRNFLSFLPLTLPMTLFWFFAFFFSLLFSSKICYKYGRHGRFG